MRRSSLLLTKNGRFLTLGLAAGGTADYTNLWPTDNGSVGQALRLSSDGSTFEWFTPGSGGGGGTVTSVALSVPSIFSVTGSPITTSGTLTLALANQTGNTVFAGPDGTTGAPTFRSLVAADIPSLDASKITTGTVAYARLPVGTTANTLAAGNDSRLHTQNTDAGTTAASFQLDSGNSGVRIKNVSGALHIRNAGDTAIADLVVGNLTVSGTTTTVNSETVSIADNILELNNNVTSGTPTEDMGLRGLRGASTAASLKWVESGTEWRAGVEGSEKKLAQIHKQTFTSASITSNTLSISHGLNEQYPVYQVYDNAGRPWIVDTVPGSTNSSTLALDFTGITVSGTWIIRVVG